MADGSKRPVCAVVGVGPGNGEALARRFAADGYAIALMARRTELTAKLAGELPGAKSYACDVTEAASVEAAFAATRSDLGDVDALIYNAGSGVWGNVEEVKAEDLERSWRVNTLGLFLSGQQAIPAMRKKGQGAIIVVGATASRRGAAGAAAFAQSKMAQRALAESMARHLWPAGIHVALIVVDGVVGGPVTRARFGDRPGRFLHRSSRRRCDRRRPCQTGPRPPGVSKSKPGRSRRSGERAVSWLVCGRRNEPQISRTRCDGVLQRSCDHEAQSPYSDESPQHMPTPPGVAKVRPFSRRRPG